MSDEPMPPEGQEPEDEHTPEPERQEEEPFDRERAMATITKLREFERQAKKLARERDELAKRIKEREDADKTDAERQAERLAALEAERLTWEAERQDYRLRLAVYSRAADLGIADADLALAALDRAAIEWSEDGAPANLEEVLNDLLDRKPLLRGEKRPPRKPSIDAGAGAQERRGPSLTAEELEWAKRLEMSPEQYAAYKQAKTLDDYRRLRERQKTE
jgi:hypothetical protein